MTRAAFYLSRASALNGQLLDVLNDIVADQDIDPYEKDCLLCSLTYMHSDMVDTVVELAKILGHVEVHDDHRCE